MRKEAKANMTRGIQEARQNAKSLTGDVKKSVEEAIKQMDQQLKELDNPNNPGFSKEVNDMLKQGWDEQNKAYQQSLKDWEKEWPASPQQLIRQRLTYFLELSSTVDFSAKLGKGPESTMVFLNQDYEGQSSDWKLLYRCGKPSVDAARAVAQQWLTELK